MLHFPSVMREAVAGFLELIFPPFGWPGTGVIAALAKWMTGCCRPGAEQSVCWAKGGLLMTRSSMFHEVGEFDQDFFMFYEEIDLCLRAREAGWTIWQTSTTSYIHEGRQSTKLRGDRVQLAAASGYAYYRKHHGLRGAMLWRLQYFLIQHVFVRLRRALGRMFRGVFRVRYSLASE